MLFNALSDLVGAWEHSSSQVLTIDRHNVIPVTLPLPGDTHLANHSRHADHCLPCSFGDNVMCLFRVMCLESTYLCTGGRNGKTSLLLLLLLVLLWLLDKPTLLLFLYFYVQGNHSQVSLRCNCLELVAWCCFSVGPIKFDDDDNNKNNKSKYNKQQPKSQTWYKRTMKHVYWK